MNSRPSQYLLSFERDVVAAEQAALSAKAEGKRKAELDKIRAKLSNPAFVEKVPADVLEEHRGRELRAVETARHIEERIASLR